MFNGRNRNALISYQWSWWAHLKSYTKCADGSLNPNLFVGFKVQLLAKKNLLSLSFEWHWQKCWFKVIAFRVRTGLIKNHRTAFLLLCTAKLFLNFWPILSRFQFNVIDIYFDRNISVFFKFIWSQKTMSNRFVDRFSTEKKFYFINMKTNIW